MGPGGSFVVVWSSGIQGGVGPDGDQLGVAGRRYASDGTALAGEFVANTTTLDGGLHRGDVEPDVGCGTGGDPRDLRGRLRIR